MTWLVVEMCKIAHAAASVPYLAFICVPVDALTGTAPTGYDRQGCARRPTLRGRPAACISRTLAERLAPWQVAVRQPLARGGARVPRRAQEGAREAGEVRAHQDGPDDGRLTVG